MKKIYLFVVLMLPLFAGCSTNTEKDFPGYSTVTYSPAYVEHIQSKYPMPQPSTNQTVKAKNEKQKAPN